jgi:PDZ domain-containing protein
MRFGYLMVLLLFMVIGAAVVRTFQLNSTTGAHTSTPGVPIVVPASRFATPTRSVLTQIQPTVALPMPVAPAFTPVPAQPRSGAPATGALIKWVDVPSAANKVGLRQTDIIARFDGMPVDANHYLVDLIESKKPGDYVQLIVIRGIQALEFNPQLRGSPWDNNVAYLGVQYVQQGSAPPENK